MKTIRSISGFTLLELMIVVIIIGILLAIAIPVYRNIVSTVERSTCQANVRIIEGAAVQYWHGHGKYPDNLNQLVSPAYLQAIPVCPEGGSYSYDKDSGIAECSKAAHR